MGDFNAKIGNCQPGEAFYEKNRNRCWMWENPDGNTRNPVDFRLSSQRGIVEDCNMITNVDIGSDYKIMVVRAKNTGKKLARFKIIKTQKKNKLDIKD